MPADHRWFRDLAVADALVQTMRPYRNTWRAALEEMRQARRAEIDAIIRGSDAGNEKRILRPASSG